MQKDTEEEVKEHLRNNLHLQEKVMFKKVCQMKRFLALGKVLKHLDV